MDQESLKAASVLAAIANSNYQMSCFADGLRQSKDVAKVSVDLECARNSNYFDYGIGSPYLFNWYVDITLADDRSFAVIIELFWNDDEWFVESRIETPGENGPHSLVEIPECHAIGIEDLIEALTDSTTYIIKAAKGAIPVRV